jgi:nucleoside-diphosphate-sugar epimerase
MRLLVSGGSGFIGTNLLAVAPERGHATLNLDLAAPLDAKQEPWWHRCDLLDREALLFAFQRFAPTHVVHLAARTDTHTADPLEAYPQNTLGTRNLLDAVRATPSVERLIVTSSQFVVRPGYTPAHERDYAPHTVYGKSKVVTEELTRSAVLDCAWTLVRPTTVWGPWCLRHRDGFFRALRRGLYLHPGRRPCIRSYGYVENVVDQILRLLDAPEVSVHEKTLYVGDAPAPLLDWVNAFSEELIGRPARVAPRFAVRTLAVAGDVLGALGARRFPITTSRYRSMTEDYVADLEPTFAITGPPPVDLREGVRRTLAWLAEYEAAQAERQVQDGRETSKARRSSASSES